MDGLQLRSVDNDTMYEVCLEENGIRECCFVSSMHLVAEKEIQLRQAIQRKALNAFVETKAQQRFDVA